MNMTIDLVLILTCLKWLAIISSITFGLSIVLIPFIIGRLDEKSFLSFEKRSSAHERGFSVLFLLGAIFRNLIGLILLVAGIAMLFLPVQGLLTILLSLLLISFPGKQKLFQILIRQQKIQLAFDWIRKRQQKKPFTWPPVDP
jgi:hypothetical protein